MQINIIDTLFYIEHLPNVRRNLPPVQKLKNTGKLKDMKIFFISVFISH